MSEPDIRSVSVGFSVVLATRISSNVKSNRGAGGLQPTYLPGSPTLFFALPQRQVTNPPAIALYLEYAVNNVLSTASGDLMRKFDLIDLRQVSFAPHHFALFFRMYWRRPSLPACLLLGDSNSTMQTTSIDSRSRSVLLIYKLANLSLQIPRSALKARQRLGAPFGRSQPTRQTKMSRILGQNGDRHRHEACVRFALSFSRVYRVRIDQHSALNHFFTARTRGTIDSRIFKLGETP